jgi:hypothetical protein
MNPQIIIPEEEHNRTRIPKLIHDVEVGNGLVVARVDFSERGDFVLDLGEQFVHGHYFGVGGEAEADYDYALFFLDLKAFKVSICLELG